MKVKSESEVARSCLTLSNPMDSSFPSSSIHGIFQARVLEWGAIAFSIVYLKCAKRVLSFLITQKRKKLITVIQICLLAIWWWWFHIEELACQCRRHSVQFNSVQSLSRVRLFATPWTTARQASLSITNSRSPPKPMSIESMMPSDHLILYRPLLLLPSIFPSIRVSSNESALCIRWPKYWSFSLNISPSNEHPGLISFRMGWLDFLAVQGTRKSLLQHHSSKASILRHSTFFIVQLSHLYMTTGKTLIWLDGPLLAK